MLKLILMDLIKYTRVFTKTKINNLKVKDTRDIWANWVKHSTPDSSKHAGDNLAHLSESLFGKSYRRG